MKFIAVLVVLILLAFAALFFASLYVVLAPAPRHKHKEIKTPVKKPEVEPLGESKDINGIEIQQGILMS